MKKFIILILTLCTSVAAFCQTSNVTATITDSDSTLWENASCRFIINNPSGQPPILFNGEPANTTPSCTVNASGVMTVTLDRTDQMIPNGIMWTPIICPLASVSCQTLPSITVTTATLNLTSFIDSQIVAPRFPAQGNAFGYADVEIEPMPGSSPENMFGSYYNVAQPCQRNFVAGAFACNGGGTANAAGALQDVQFNGGGALEADTGNFVYNASTHSLGVNSINAIFNPTQGIDNTCATDVHTLLQNKINAAGTDFYVPSGCYNLGNASVGITIPSNITKFDMSPTAFFHYSGTGTCVVVNGVGTGPTQPPASHITVNCQNDNTIWGGNFAWVPQGIMTAIAYAGGLTGLSGSGVCQLNAFNNDPSNTAYANVTITSGAVSAIALVIGGKHATVASTSASINTSVPCTGTATAVGTATVTTTLNTPFVTQEDTTSIGIQCVNCGVYDFYPSAKQFAIGVDIAGGPGSSTGSAENNIFPGYIQDNFHGMQLDQLGTGTNNGFTNQQRFYGGQIRINSGNQCPGGHPVAGSTYVQMNLDGSGSQNANTFFSTELQGTCVQHSIDDFGTNNRYLGVRFELNIPSAVVFEATSQDNYIDFPASIPGATYTPTIVDLGVGNKFHGIGGFADDFQDANFNTMWLTDTSGVLKANYQSGLTPSGADGTACLLTFAGGSPHAVGYVTLLGGVIPSNAVVTMVSGGTEYFPFTASPTSATGSNLTTAQSIQFGVTPATNCTGTAVVTSSLGKTNAYQFQQRARIAIAGDAIMGEFRAPTLTAFTKFNFLSTPITALSSSGPELVNCPTGGSGTQYCGADGVWHGVTVGSASGSVTLTNGTGTVNTTAACNTFNSNCAIKLTICNANGGGTSTQIGVPSVGTVTPGTSFLVFSRTATNTIATGDQSTYCWQVN